MRRTPPPTRNAAPTESLVGLTLAAGRRGLWVAVADCRLDEDTWRPVSGRVVDFDAEFGELNQRLAQAGVRSVAVVFVEPQRASGLRQPPPPTDLFALVPTIRLAAEWRKSGLPEAAKRVLALGETAEETALTRRVG